MKLIDRFTLDDVSAQVWWPLTMVVLVGLVLTFPAGNRAVDDARAEAAARAADLSTAKIQLSPTLPPTSLQSLVHAGDFDDATAVLTAYAEDPVWSDVRVWTPQFTLWASSAEQEQHDEITSGEADNDDYLRAATEQGAVSVVTDRLPTGGPGPTTFHAYTRIVGAAGGAYITDFEARDSVLLAEVHREWLGYRIVGAVALLIVLGLAIASMREPKARIGTNVPFFPESVPVGHAVIGVDRAAELQEADDRIQDRITGLQERLDESERLRLKAEAQLQQALTALGSGPRGITGPKPAPEAEAPPRTRTPVKARQPKPAARPEPVAQPRPIPAAQPRPVPAARPRPAQPRRAVQPTQGPQAAPAARQQPKPAAQPQPAPQPQPQAQPARRDRPAAAASQPSAAAQPAAPNEVPAAKTAPRPMVTPQPAAKAPPAHPERHAGKHEKPDPVTVQAEEVAVTAAPGANGEEPARSTAPERPARREMVVVPEPERAGVAAKAGRDSDAEVLDVLNRLVPEGEESRTDAEPGDLRARLARTAALKKPGSRERQQQREAAEDGPTQE